MSEREEALRQVNTAIESVRHREAPLGNAFQAVISTPERLTIVQLDNLRDALHRVADMLDELKAQRE